MAQRDYVSRGRASGAKRKSNSRGKKRRSGSGVSRTMMVLALAVLATFAGGLYFLTQHKPGGDVLLPVASQHPKNGLPPKPEERWSYIKELENRQVGVTAPTEPSGGAPLPGQPQLTDEQRQLLEQMQADMRQAPTQLSEVPYNDQTPPTVTPRNSRLPEQRYAQQTPAPQSTYQESVRQPEVAPRNPLSQPQTNARPSQTPTSPPVSREREKERSVPVTNATPAPLQTAREKPAEKASGQKWLIQCGSFRNTDQAESVRAQLAFGGIESRITSGGGWHRVLLGPYASRPAADKMIGRLKGNGMSGCITLAAGG
ncbi:cell division protein FtsN [Edwardsiella ictaluri]|uniref:cell division protein FtsN n=1 Tax=Edwardsiella ictaluri TaxID=67780 RepID=UPI0009BF4018|nr:cell division protein FtsN [Edwardsiella ictaluri]ARD39763.1 cell division protein FtsN [Edwardsiella ictaluri]QPW28212.1 cell division protein FtsN [Edwardsiella ictaluri]